jgi:endonuclease/exonuclease/phosphatase family metal-dependent hydrolase
VRAATTDLLTGHPQRAVVVLGDLNDEVESATTSDHRPVLASIDL